MMLKVGEGVAEEQTGGGSGLFIAFEGIDGTGKTTQIRLLTEWLQALGHRVVPTREPTDGPFGQQIRRLYVDRQAVTLEEELELFLADRRQHIEEVIAPGLADGRIVLTDRYYFSTAAYQGAAGLDPQEIIRRNQAFAPLPDLVILLTLPPSVGIHRIRTLRGESLNDFEQEEALHRVAEIFDGLDFPCIQRVDADRSQDLVHQDIRHHLQPMLRDWQKSG